jgi:hypothetical protein
MKKLRALFLIPFLAIAAWMPMAAQTPHPAFKVVFAQASAAPSATVSWVASTTPGGTVTIYRCVGTPCTALSSFTQLVAGVVPAGPYVDTTITAGSYSYYGVLVVNGQPSAASNIATGTLSPQPLTGFAVARIRRRRGPVAGGGSCWIGCLDGFEEQEWQEMR